MVADGLSGLDLRLLSCEDSVLYQHGVEMARRRGDTELL